MVMATQNPIEYEGTYPLPEAQLDRFAMRVSLGYPTLQEESRMLSEQTSSAPPAALALARLRRCEPALGHRAAAGRQGAGACRAPRLRLAGRRQGGRDA